MIYSFEIVFMNSLKGHLLIATPQLVAPLFARSVVLLIDHGEEGAMGVILNRPLQTTLSDLAGKVFAEDFRWDKPLHLGGPVPGSLIVLHGLEDLGDREIAPGVFATLDAATVQEIIHRRPEPSLVFANYSGWAAGQLEDELQGNSWLTLPATEPHVFWTGEVEHWKAAVSQVQTRKLFDFLNLKAPPGDPRWN
jgi:putative transcriptional regulator